MFKVNNKCLYCWLWIYFAALSSVSIVNFEHVNAGWDISENRWRFQGTWYDKKEMSLGKR